MRLRTFLFLSFIFRKLDTLLSILPFALFLSYLISLSDSSIAFCMDCKYVFHPKTGDLALDPKTGEPLQNCSKTDYVVCMETIESLTKYLLPSANEANSSTTPDTTVKAPSENYEKSPSNS